MSTDWLSSPSNRGKHQLPSLHPTFELTHCCQSVAQLHFEELEHSRTSHSLYQLSSMAEIQTLEQQFDGISVQDENLDILAKNGTQQQGHKSKVC